MVRKWNEEKREYKPYELPEGATCYEVDMDKVVNCARCGGQCYLGMDIHLNKFIQKWDLDIVFVKSAMRKKVRN